jgi:hypothetical protein
MVVNIPRIYIESKAKERLDLYIEHCVDEVSGLGEVERRGNDFLIKKIYLLEQEVTATSCQLSPKGLASFLIKLIKDGGHSESIKLWWHSHAEMGVFWSAIDINTINSFRNGWMISIVGNKKGEYLTRIDIYDPLPLMFDGFDLEIYYEENPVLIETVKEEIHSKVKNKPIYYSNVVEHLRSMGRRKK